MYIKRALRPLNVIILRLHTCVLRSLTAKRGIFTDWFADCPAFYADHYPDDPLTGIRRVIFTRDDLYVMFATSPMTPRNS